jgi:outer membrane receptor protein involved in Fe transport
MAMSPRTRLVVVLMAGQLAAACQATSRAPQPRAVPGSGRIITADVIQRWNVADAYEALERVGGYTVMEGRGGSARIQQRRGQNSIINGAGTPILVLDGVRDVNPNVLRQIRAMSILSIEILSGADATVRYGTGAAAGAVIFTTRAF